MPNRRELGYVSAGSTSTVYVSTGIYGRATGGIGSPTAVTISGVNYEYLTFNSTGTLTVTTAGWFDYLAIGGGGGSRQVTASTASGGGGAGQVIIGSVYLDANQTITIGAGSGFFAVATQFVEASPTTIAATAPFAIRALGNQVSTNGQVLKCLGYVGGGVGTGTSGTAEIAAVTESTQQGYRGGAANFAGSGSGGGGGGQSGRGADGTTNTGGVGGTGVDISTFIGGSASYRATGGGGGGFSAGGAGGNSSASSNAGSNNSTPSSAAANSGSGGGAGYGVVTTGNGGSGVCFIRWKTS